MTNLIKTTTSLLGLVVALVLVASHVAKLGHGLQQQQRQTSQATASVAQQVENPLALPAPASQQQQQVQEANQVVAPQSQQSSSSSKQQTPAKSNHRLVNKLKDARYRRRQRHHQRHHLKHKKRLAAAGAAGGKAAAVVPVAAVATIAAATTTNEPQLAATSSSTVASSPLTTLESIVDEVARVGSHQSSHQVTSAKPQNQAQVQQQTSSSTPTTTELNVSARPPSVAPVTASASASTPTTTTSAIQLHNKSPPASVHSSRGFFLTTMLSKIMNVLNVTEFALEMRDGISSRASCMACNAVVGLFLSPLYSKEVFSAAIRTVCTSFKIQPARVCSGLVESFQDDFEYIRKNTKLSRDEVCAVVFGVDCARRSTYNLFWTVPIPEPPHQRLNSTFKSTLAASGDKTSTTTQLGADLFEYRKSGPPAVGATQQGNNNKTFEGDKYGQYTVVGASDEMLDSAGTTSFVHITDIHVDPYYEAGSLNDCNEPLCCRATSGPVAPDDRRRQAGKWGDYGNCDAPIRTIKSALNRIRSQHSSAEYWIWTGDISPHDIWNISKSEAANNVRLVSKMIRDYSNGVPVFPVIGNHEAHPVNSFAPPEIKGKFSMSWLYDLLADEWSVWLPKEALKTLRVGGYYKLQVRKGFRIIALNTNYCARLNPWSFYDPVDPANQLKWLVEELLAAELSSDKVHLIGHVPPDNRECTQAWLFNFINIVDRFKDTIVGQFYGHTHRDEWRIMYSMMRPDEPIGVQYIGPSITPFTENNPAYRVYHQDKQGHLIDSHTYYFNLTEANESPAQEPQWRFSYSTQKHLNMSQGLNANEWHQYLQRLHDDEQLFDSFFKNYYRSSDVKLGQVCKAKCKHQMLSDLRLTHPYKTKPKPFLANRKTSNHNHHHNNHRSDNMNHNHHHHHHHHKRHRHHSE